MEEKKFNITMRDLMKYEVLQQLIKGEIKGYQAASLLGYTKVHISRLKKRLQNGDFESLLRPTRPSPRKTPQRIVQEIVSLHEQKYWDFNILHFKDKLEEIHNIRLSYETIRKVLISRNLHTAKKRKKVYRRRRRMPKAGMLIQMDSSEHNWLPFIKKKWWLTATIDDATNEVPFAKFYSYDGVFNNMDVLRKTIEKKGLFYALYVDKASQFKTTRYGGLHVNVAPEQEDTHIERSLKELGITLILANSPQAKGRVERLFGTLQDRLIKEMRLAGIKNYEEANKFLIEEFLPYHNKKFAHTDGIEREYKKLSNNVNLDLIFCKKYERKVNGDNTIQFHGEVIQIPPSNYKIAYAKRTAEVCLLEDDRIYILYQNKLIHTTKVSKNRSYKQIEELLSKRGYLPYSV